VTMAFFNPRDWYWQIATNEGGFYSSRRNIYVPESDAEFTAWQTANGAALPPMVANEGEVWFYAKDFQPEWLWNGTTMSQPAAGAYTKPQLGAYNANARYIKVNGGMTDTRVSVVPFHSDPASRNALINADALAKAVPGETINFKLTDGSFVTLTGSQLTSVVSSMSAFVQACFDCENANLTAINGGTLTTLAAIDTAYAAVSSVYP
jgi:Domain of unknown function (DUF4376)